MSCFICDNETISVIARAFKDYGIFFKDNYGTFTADDVNVIGQVLLNQNYNSYNSRYDEVNEAPEFKANMKIPYDEGIVLGCVECYMYQACETSDWDDSFIRISLLSLEGEIAERLAEKMSLNVPWGYVNFSK